MQSPAASSSSPPPPLSAPVESSSSAVGGDVEDGDDNSKATLSKATTSSSYTNDDNNNSDDHDDNNKDAAASAVVESNVVLCKLCFLLSFLGSSCISPFLGVYLSACGFPASSIGLMGAVGPTTNLLVIQALTYVVDKYHIGRQVYSVSIICAASFLLLSLLVSSVPFGVTRRSSSSSAMKEDDNNIAVVTVFFILHMISKTPNTCLLDHEARDSLPESQKTRYGSIRSFGAVGFGIGALLFGFLQQHHGFGPCFVIYTCLAVIVSGLLFLIERSPSVSSSSSRNNGNSAAEKQKEDLPLMDILRMLLTHRSMRRLLIHIVFSVIMTLGTSVNMTFLILYLRQDLGASQSLLGLTIVATVFFEVPILHFSEFVHTLFDDQTMMLLALLSWAIRAIGYSLLQNPWWVLALEPMHGITYGFAWLSVVHAVNDYFPPQLSASAFGLVHTVYSGAGPLLGYSLGGVLYGYLGARRFYRYAGAMMALAAVSYFALDRYYAAFTASSGDSSHGAAATNGSSNNNQYADDEPEQDREQMMEGKYTPRQQEGFAVASVPVPPPALVEGKGGRDQPS